MPSSSPKQAKFMRAVAHGWKKPGGGGPSPEVAKDFMKADMAEDAMERQHKMADTMCPACAAKK